MALTSIMSGNDDPPPPPRQQQLEQARFSPKTIAVQPAPAVQEPPRQLAPDPTKSYEILPPTLDPHRALAGPPERIDLIGVKDEADRERRLEDGRSMKAEDAATYQPYVSRQRQRPDEAEVAAAMQDIETRVTLANGAGYPPESWLQEHGQKMQKRMREQEQEEESRRKVCLS